MSRFLFWLYVTLYIFVAGSLALLEIASIKIGWAFLSTLVMPMGYVFLAVNIPLAIIGVAKIGHVVFLHSAQHHHNVMRSIRQADMQPPYPAMVQEEEYEDDIPILSRQSTTSGTYAGHVQTSKGVQPGQDKKSDSDNVIVARMLVDYPGISIRGIHKKTGIPVSSIGVTNAWKNRNT